MNRHVRIDDSKPRQGKTRKLSLYEQYLARICGCNHPGAHPPCSGCTSAIDEEQFNEEFALVRPSYLQDATALNEIIWNHHYDDHQE